MKIYKTCFFEKISTIKSVTKAYLLSNLKHMGGKNAFLAGTLTAILNTATPATPAMADNLDITTQGEAITCETKQACQDLTKSIQAQINELEAKGLGNLSDDEFENYVLLSDNLLAAEDLETLHNEKLIATENKKQEKQEVVIATENQKQAELKVANTDENKKQSNLDSDDEKEKALIDAKLKAQDSQIAGLRGALLEN